jgi:hypothetical protein
MKDADDFHGVLAKAINRKIGQPLKYEFPRVRLAAGSSVLRKLRQQVNLAMNRKRYAAGRRGTAMLFDVIADVS